MNRSALAACSLTIISALGCAPGPDATRPAAFSFGMSPHLDIEATTPVEVLATPASLVPTAPAPSVPTGLTRSPAPGGQNDGSNGNSGASYDGRVLALHGGGEHPLPNARVATTDGREAVSDAQGRFKLRGGAPADGTLIASCSGYMASTVVALFGA